jgi:Ca2+-binding RTX toxin-like protein
LDGDEDKQDSSSDSRYDVIEAACSIGSIIATDGTNRPHLMLGCDVEDVMYGKSGNDVLQGRLENDRLYGNSGDDNPYKAVQEEMNSMLEQEMMLFLEDLMMMMTFP